MSRSNGSSSWLSPQGAQRRDEILSLARAEARSRRRRREIVTKVAADIVFVVMSIVIALVARMQMTGVQQPGPLLVNAPNPAPPPAPLVQIDFIQTDPSILDRLSIRDDPPRWQSIDDDELIRAFAEAGQQVGIIRFDGKTELMTR